MEKTTLILNGLPVTSMPHKPKYIVASPEPLELLQLSRGNRCQNMRFRGIFPEPVITRLNTPCIYAAPEIIFHDRVSPAVYVCPHSHGSEQRISFVLFVLRDQTGGLEGDGVDVG